MKYLIEIEVPKEVWVENQFNWNLIEQLNRLLAEDVIFYSTKLLSVKEVLTINH